MWNTPKELALHSFVEIRTCFERSLNFTMKSGPITQVTLQRTGVMADNHIAIKLCYKYIVHVFQTVM